MSKSRALYPNASSYDYPSFSNLLRSVLGSNSSTVRFQEGYETYRLDSIASKEPEMAEAPLEFKVESANHSNNISPLAPSDKFEPQSAPSLPIPLLSFYNDEPRQVMEQQNSEHNSTLSHVVTETPPADGYSWRKYGQKQVKSSKNSRSYYRCSNTKCHAKKQVQRCDNSGRIIDVVYLGQHNHDYDKCNFSKGLVPSPPGLPSSCLVDSVQKSDGEDISICSEARQSPVHLAESEQQSSSSSNGNVGIGIKVEDQNINELESVELARHQKKSSSGITDSQDQEKHCAAEPRPRKRIRERSKETSIVVQTSTDGSISNDGYRWRKYGQKMVKGNTQLRSYYRCTSAGCPSRKHVERAMEDTTTATITYEGKHNHEMPTPKKQRGSQCLPPQISPPLPIISSSHCKKTRTFSTQKASNKWRLSGKEGGYLMDEKVLELGGEKALESAQTLLSIGIDVRPY